MGAEAYGLLLFSRCFSALPKSIKFENGTVARTIAEYAASVCGIMADVSVSMRRNCGEGYSLSIPGAEEREQLFEVFGHEVNEPHLRIHRENIENECCVSAFLRGAFIASGTITDPRKDYRLEFMLPYKHLSEDLKDMLAELPFALNPVHIRRRSNYVIYLKGSENIQDFLTYIGASAASMEIMQIKMYKEARNDINRRTNFETANIDKTYSASAKQTAAIAFIHDSVGLSKLDDEQRELAELRLHNPEMSLKDLSLKLGISRSGVNHRMQKLLRTAEELQGKEKQ